jgi:hypothetical protein
MDSLHVEENIADKWIETIHESDREKVTEVFNKEFEQI